MHRLLRLPWARARHAKRKTQGERPLAEIKQAMGFRRVRLRGLANVRGEWDLVSAACNLRAGMTSPRFGRDVHGLTTPRVPRLLRWLCQPQHPGRAGCERFTLALFPEPRRSLGSVS